MSVCLSNCGRMSITSVTLLIKQSERGMTSLMNLRTWVALIEN